MTSDRMKWWREARFGMFIHWGLYSALGGRYHGEEVPTAGEWIMNAAKIPLSEYRTLASSFDPVDFDARRICELARNAGMRYLVFTAKHHDGFAMYRSETDPYNIYDSTPYHRDPLRDLQEACREYGLKLCIYYSQTIDWADPDAFGNNWDFDDRDPRDFDRYLERKCLPQLRELLENYGEIGLLWFDMPHGMSREQSERIVNFVHGIRPDCIISGRIGNGLSDYRSTGDNSIPFLPVTSDWECPATLNHTWGYKYSDNDWKSSADLIRKLVNINGKNGNYLLNIGPDGTGKVPEECVRILRELGTWMQKNGDCIYATTPAPVPVYEQNELYTHKPGNLFIHFFAEHKNYISSGVYMIRNMDIPIRKCYFLDTPEEELKWDIDFPEALGVHYTRILLPEMPDPRPDRVLCVEYSGEIRREEIR